MNWFVTGTDTGIGKTLVSSAMLSLLAGSGLRAVGMKPVASDCISIMNSFLRGIDPKLALLKRYSK